MWVVFDVLMSSSDQTNGVLIGCNRVIVTEQSENGSVIRVFEVCGDGVGLVQSFV